MSDCINCCFCFTKEVHRNYLIDLLIQSNNYQGNLWKFVEMCMRNHLYGDVIYTQAVACRQFHALAHRFCIPNRGYQNLIDLVFLYQSKVSVRFI